MVARQPKVPRTPPNSLVRTDADVQTIRPVLWRVHRTTGQHVLPWNRLRTFGPLSTGRYDPHPGPASDHPESSVAYAGLDLATCLAEIFQGTRTIDAVTSWPHATAWQPIRPLRLLDLTDTWPVRNGAAASITSAPRAIAQGWSRAIRTQWPDLDGIFAQSSWTARPVIVLWQPAVDTFPAHPLFSRPLSHPLLWSLVRQGAGEIGFELR